MLGGWEEIYQRGLLTIWVLLAVRDQARYAADMAGFVADHTRGTVTVDERSLYRALRRLARLELIAETPGPGARTGADRKYHRLTATGRWTPSSSATCAPSTSRATPTCSTPVRLRSNRVSRFLGYVIHDMGIAHRER